MHALGVACAILLLFPPQTGPQDTEHPETIAAKARLASAKAAPAEPVTPFASKGLRNRIMRIDAREIDCIATTIYHEARGESERGQIAIAEVVISRMESGKWPKDACRVVAQPNQFSFVRRGWIPPVPMKALTRMRDIATRTVHGIARTQVRGATYFHARYVRPDWRLSEIGRIGQHVFYAD